MPKRKRHHFVPKLYLSRFTNDDGVLWQYERGKELPVPVQPRDAAVESYLYSPQVGENPKSDEIEAFLAEHVEGPSAQPLGKLIRGTDLTTEERSLLSLYIAFQELRVPGWRDAIAGFMEDISKRILELHLAHPKSFRRKLERATGRPHSHDDVERIAKSYQDGKLAIKATKVGWLQSLLETGQDLVPTVSKLRWLVVEVAENADFEFVTSDSPITKVLTDARVPRHFAGGWESPSAESTLTLTPKHVLVLTPDGRCGRKVVAKHALNTARPWLQDVNARTVRRARRFVFSRRPQPFITDLLSSRADR